VVQRPRAGEATVRAPPALDLSTLPQDDQQTKQLRIIQEIISNGWPALLAALSFIISTNLSDDLFVEVLASYQAMTNVSGMLGLSTPRDAFFNSLAKFSVPARVVSSLDSYNEPPQTPRSATAALSEGLGLGASPTQPPGLSERNMACLKVFVGSAMFLAGSLGESWYGILEALQNADYVLTIKNANAHSTPNKRASMFSPVGIGGATGTSASRSVSASGSQTLSGPTSGARHPLLTDLDSETLLNAIQRLFDSSKNLEDPAFKDFIDALCKLSAEMVGMQVEGGPAARASLESVDETGGTQSLMVPKLEPSHRRRISGIYLPKTQVRDTPLKMLKFQ